MDKKLELLREMAAEKMRGGKDAFSKERSEQMAARLGITYDDLELTVVDLSFEARPINQKRGYVDWHRTVAQWWIDGPGLEDPATRAMIKRHCGKCPGTYSPQ